MSSYCIKYIWGPGGPHYPGEDKRIHFSYEKYARDFIGCTSFLLYETGGNPRAEDFGLEKRSVYGRKTIYAQGTVISKEVGYEPAHPAEHYYYVEVNIEKRVHPKNGIPLWKIKDILGLKECSTIQRKGGLFWITGKQFELLSKELKKTNN